MSARSLGRRVVRRIVRRIVHRAWRGASSRVTRGVTIAAAAYVGAVVVAAACADFTVPAAALGPDTLVAEPSFARDIQPILTARCATVGCHTAVTHQAGLVLQAGIAYDSLVGRPSTLAPQFVRVAPGDADASWLLRMIGPDPAARFGIERMPLGRAPLTDNQIATIVRWVTQGALRN